MGYGLRTYILVNETLAPDYELMEEVALSPWLTYPYSCYNLELEKGDISQYVMTQKSQVLYVI